MNKEAKKAYNKQVGWAVGFAHLLAKRAWPEGA
jgi:hypothetical protein